MNLNPSGYFSKINGKIKITGKQYRAA